MTAPTQGGLQLELRVDVDSRGPDSAVLNRVSGDIFELNRLGPPGGPGDTSQVFRESWVVDAPAVQWSAGEVVITGAVRWWRRPGPQTSLALRIPWGSVGGLGPAEVRLDEAGVPLPSSTSYRCDRVSNAFRDVTLEVDVCESVNAPPLLPTYDTHAHVARPAALTRRTLTVPAAYDEAGIALQIRPGTSVIDDSVAEFETWSPEELHHAMEDHFSQFQGTWPNWQLWGLLAGLFDDERVGGIMFDAAGQFGGAGEPPERQGFVVFRGHDWFKKLVGGVPGSKAEVEAARKFLYTWVHEAGHAFNLLHSWNKARPDSLSWMNYDWRYDERHGDGRFWSAFPMRFDDEELVHIRHGERSSVIMGGDPWSSGSHLETPSAAFTHLEGKAPVEFLVRSQEYFDFMEPVQVEFRLRNATPDLDIEIDTKLHPEFGNVVAFIRRGDGRVLEYAPVCCKLAPPSRRRLRRHDPRLPDGDDRYSESVHLTYGAHGFYFDQPGEYLVRAVYAAGGLVIPSNVHRIRVGSPTSKDEDRLAQDFFGPSAGLSLYLNGSRSPFLRKGTEALEAVSSRLKGRVGARVNAAVAKNAARPFFQVEKGVLKEAVKGNPDRALALSQAALDVVRKEQAPAFNLPQHEIVSEQCRVLIATGQPKEAKKQLEVLGQDLSKRGVNPPVLAAIKASADAL